MAVDTTFGIFLLNSLPPWKTQTQVLHEGLEQIRVAEELGYDVAWVAEHNARVYGTVGSAHVYLAAAAAQTTTIKLGSAVSRIPLHHPLHLAEDYALVDQISRGRLYWGIGKGYDDLEFASYGVALDERDQRFSDAEEIVVGAWREGAVHYDGEVFRIGSREEPVALYPRPFQAAPPVFVMAAKSDQTVLYAARHGYSFVLGPYPDTTEVRRKADLYRSEAAAAGFSERHVEEALRRSGQTFNVHVAESTQRAVDEFEDAFMWFMEVQANRGMFGYSPDFQPYGYYLEQRGMALGTADDVAERLAGFSRATGLGHVLCWFDCGGQPQVQVLDAMERFARTVVPTMRATAAASGAPGGSSLA